MLFYLNFQALLITHLRRTHKSEYQVFFENEGKRKAKKLKTEELSTSQSLIST